MASDKLFLDTNVFVYQLDSGDKRKQKRAEALVRDAVVGGQACISYQVVQECANVLLRKAAVPLPQEAFRLYLDEVLMPLVQVAPSAALIHRALDLQQRWRYGFYDALVVASALSAGCTQLLTEDLQHGQKIEGLTVVNPFV
jgi:predicted nucleic acid-binding protein